MSWSVSVPKGHTYGTKGTTISGFSADADEAFSAMKEGLTELDDRVNPQFEAAKAAVLEILHSGVVGPDNEGNSFRVNLNGHAGNTNSVSISISQLDKAE